MAYNALAYRGHQIKESSHSGRTSTLQVRLEQNDRTWLLLTQRRYTIGNAQSKAAALAAAKKFIDQRIERLSESH